MNSEIPRNNYPEERRLVTVMFADVQGFTSLAENLDFETVSDLLKDIWLRLDRVIEANGGYIDKHMGDGVLAVWGAPSAGDNDAESAVTAGLALQASMAEYNREAHHALAGDLMMRVGIHSGPVFAGYIGLHNEYTILGDTVNIASRLEQYAEAGAVIISESTHLLTREKFAVSNPTPVQLKGKHEPVMTYIIEGPQARSEHGSYHGAASMETHMIGRQLEMDFVSEIYKEFRKNPQPEEIIITGEPGIGKSRFMLEAALRMEIISPGMLVLNARALGQARQVPFYLWKILWHNYFNLRDDNAGNNSELFKQGIQKLWGAQPGFAALEAAHVIGHMIGLDWSLSPYLAALKTPQARTEKAYQLTRQLFAQIAQTHPILLVMDDLQWADNKSLELLEYLLASSSSNQLPLFVMAGCRPEFLQQNESWASKARILNLGPLPVNAELVASAYPVLRKYSDSVLNILARQCEGNPYFLEEMVKNLIKSNTEITVPASLEATISRMRSSPPESLQAALQARLDTLPRDVRSIALLAALVGRVFWVGAVVAAIRMASKFGTGSLSHFNYEETENIVRETLKQLEHAELVFPKAGTSFSQEQEYIFKSSLLRDVAYNLILLRYRPYYHKAVADWLANRPDVDFRFMAAEHYELANWPAHAARQYEQAARHAQEHGAIEEAEKLFARAAGLREQSKSQKTIPIGGR